METAKDMAERLTRWAEAAVAKTASIDGAMNNAYEAGLYRGIMRSLCYDLEARNREIDDLLAEVQRLREEVSGFGMAYAQDQIADHLTEDL